MYRWSRDRRNSERCWRKSSSIPTFDPGISWVTKSGSRSSTSLRQEESENGMCWSMLEMCPKASDMYAIRSPSGLLSSNALR